MALIPILKSYFLNFNKNDFCYHLRFLLETKLSTIIYYELSSLLLAKKSIYKKRVYLYLNLKIPTVIWGVVILIFKVTYLKDYLQVYILVYIFVSTRKRRL